MGDEPLSENGMSDSVEYGGDEALQRRLSELGVTRTFAEVRAMMARDAWSLEPAPLEDTVLAIVAGRDEQPLDTGLLAELGALRHSLARFATDAGELFAVYPAAPSQSVDELMARLEVRRAETGILMGIFAFNRVLYPQLFTTLAPLAGSLEKAIGGLDRKRTLIAGSPEIFADEGQRREVERALDAIDQAIGHGFSVAARALANERSVRVGMKQQETKAVARRQAVAAAEKRKTRRRKERTARKSNR